MEIRTFFIEQEEAIREKIRQLKKVRGEGLLK